MSEPPDTKPGRIERGHAWLEHATDALIGRSADLATESDRWFLRAVHLVEHGAERAHGGIGSLAHAAFERSTRWWPRSFRRSTRERIVSMLQSEARRLSYDVSRPEFAEFSEKMALLLELVFTGAVSADDISFDPAETDASVELTEEVSDQKEHDQRHQRDPLREQQ